MSSCDHEPGIWRLGSEIEVAANFEHVKELLEKVALPWFEEAGHTKGLIDFLSDEDLGSKYKIVGFPPFMRRLILATGNLYCGNTGKAASEVMLKYCVLFEKQISFLKLQLIMNRL